MDILEVEDRKKMIEEIEKIGGDLDEKLSEKLGEKKNLGSSTPIKIIGVGGCGSSSVSYMYNTYSSSNPELEFVVCDTDIQSLSKQSVPNKMQLGKDISNGDGAGNTPKKGLEVVTNNEQEVRDLFTDGTRLAFICIGLSGGTGTGAGPRVAEIAKEAGVLTVVLGILPMVGEGPVRIESTNEGIQCIKKSSDALLIISIDRTYELYGHRPVIETLNMAHEVVATAVRGISDIILKRAIINVDIADMSFVLKDAGVILVGVGSAEGDDRCIKAAEAAVDSPLLCANDISGADQLVVVVTCGTGENTISGNEYSAIQESIQQRVSRASGSNANLIHGIKEDPLFKGEVEVIIVATGFSDRGLHVWTDPAIRSKSNLKYRTKIIADEYGNVIETVEEYDELPHSTGGPISKVSKRKISEPNGDVRTISDLMTIVREPSVENHFANKTIEEIENLITTSAINNRSNR